MNNNNIVLLFFIIIIGCLINNSSAERSSLYEKDDNNKLCSDDIENLKYFSTLESCSTDLCSGQLNVFCNQTCGNCPSCPFLKNSSACQHEHCWKGWEHGPQQVADECKALACSYCKRLNTNEQNIDPSTDPACQLPFIKNECDQIMCSVYGICSNNTNQCENECHGLGACFNSKCWCFYPHYGHDCSQYQCSGACIHGICNHYSGKCDCDLGWRGFRCNEKKCMNGVFEIDCDYGICNNGSCECFEGYSGISCSEIDNNKEKKECDNNHYGHDCSLIKCLNNCSNNGDCDGVNGVCHCYPGWSDDSCSTQLCDGCVHGECKNGVCICENGFRGPDCAIENCPGNCNGNGVCKNGICICESSWTGNACDILKCPTAYFGTVCSGNGKCHNGTCECFNKFGGANCAVSLCQDSCSNHGTCRNGRCECESGWGGSLCSVRVCLNHCSLRGECNNGTCECEVGFIGSDCSRKQCKNDCNDRGICSQPFGICLCNPQWQGDDCGTRVCPGVDSNCNGNGICLNGECHCHSLFTGNDCSLPRCENDCNFHGKCFISVSNEGLKKTKCSCFNGWEGELCQNKKCPSFLNKQNISLVCSSNGVCDKINGICICQGDYWGEDCSKVKCLNNCNGNGICQDNGICRCHSGFKGADCQIRECPNACSGHGRCHLDGTCECQAEYTKNDCSAKICASECSHRGICVDGKCNCHEGWSGQACEVKGCVPNCWHGTCRNGQCFCEDGWSGPYCQLKKCPSDCSGNGKCDTVEGKCECISGYGGKDCSSEICILGCENGKCEKGKCVCNKGWEGVLCNTQSCLNNCNANGFCVMGICRCYNGFIGDDCSRKTCTNNCHDQGKCNNGTCECFESYYGELCENKKCLSDCSGNGRCDKSKGKCYCDDYWQGADCSIPECENDCSGNGDCLAGSKGKCKCDPKWEGDDCSLLKCPKQCSNSGICKNGTCQCYSGYYGQLCDISCPNNCTDKIHGNCDTSKGICKCTNQFHGNDCSKKCQFECLNNGKCSENGQCFCYDGWSGDKCDIRSQCTSNCMNRGQCFNATCTCIEGFGAYDSSGRIRVGSAAAWFVKTENYCQHKLCLNDCSGRGTCDGNSGTCKCDSGYSGPSCNFKECEENCLGRGFCNNGTCECFPGFQGKICDEDVCPHNCNGNGKCVSGCCDCKDGYTGIDCSLKKCYMDCSNRGVCDYFKGVCSCFPPYYGEGCRNKLASVLVPGVSNIPEPIQPTLPTQGPTTTTTTPTGQEPSTPEQQAPLPTTPTTPIQEQQEQETDQIDENIPEQLPTPPEIQKTEEQLAPSQEYSVSGTLRFSIELSKWKTQYSLILMEELGNICSVHPSNVRIIDISSGSTVIKVQIRPPQPMVEASAIETARRLNNAVFGNLLTNLITSGLPKCELSVPEQFSSSGGLPRSQGCKRCRNGVEQAEKDHRDFTRKCARGLCSKQEPFSIKRECAQGCADHCLTSCKRFHDPKVRKCAASRRKFAEKQQQLYQQQAGGISSLQPQAEISTLLSISSSSEINPEIHQFAGSLIEEQNLAQLSVEDAQDRSEVFVLSDCYAECSRQCIEHCVGQFGDPIPEHDSSDSNKIKSISSNENDLPASLQRQTK